MEPLTQKVQEIRSRINHYLRQNRLLHDRSTWAQICSALDTIEDTEDAVFYYSNDLQFEYENYGQIFLSIYGFLQAMMVQQDGVEHLTIALKQETGKTINFKKRKKLQKIRQIRNEMVGHPTKGKSFFQIDRSPISKNEFHYRWIDEDGRRRNETVDSIGIVRDQQSELLKILKNIIQGLDMKEEEYKDKFKDLRLSDLIQDDIYPWKPQLMDACTEINDPNALHERSQGFSVLESIRKKVESLGTELTQRDFPLEGFQEFKTRIDHVLDRLSRMFSNENYSSVNPLDAEIYADFLFNEIEDLQDWVREQDAYFNS